ncbi:MAG: hypothetical protein SFU25_02190 [Candidatus Caenarcaniphilales bacterium]|nr:hypothetical protein [Candidatus Caenarcaniphilales bacterium]
MNISQFHFLESSGIKASGFLTGIVKSSWVSEATNFLSINDGRIYSDINYRELSDNYEKLPESNNSKPFINFLLEPEVFGFISNLDGGGTVNAAYPENWSLNETLTAGAWAISREENRLSTVDVRKWAMLDGKDDLSDEDNLIAKELMKESKDLNSISA